MLFKWRDSYSCNIGPIDKQHKKLFELGSQLYSIIDSKDREDNYDKIILLVNELKDYTIKHFRFEEILMEENQYPLYTDHKEQHERFIEKLREIEGSDIDSRQEKTLKDMLVFIADWIEGHILKSDMKYREYLNERGIV